MLGNVVLFQFSTFKILEIDFYFHFLEMKTENMVGVFLLSECEMEKRFGKRKIMFVYCNSNLRKFTKMAI